MIADSVGLGKTHLRSRFLDDYAFRRRLKALIICPAQLRDSLWQPRLDKYRIYTVIQSQEEISQSDFAPCEFANCELVLIDEFHNFRRTSANRYDNLMRALTQGKPKKLFLMTATPVTAGPARGSVARQHELPEIFAGSESDETWELGEHYPKRRN